MQSHLPNFRQKIFHTNTRQLITCLSLSYLALPNILFFLGWLQPIFALIASGCAVYIVIALTKQSNNRPYEQGITPANRWIWCGVIAFSFFLLFRSGINGFFPQGQDCFVRNPIYATLVRCDWPIILPDRTNFIYFLASWLPPALLSDLHPKESFPFWCLFAWLWAGMILMSLLMERRLGSRILIFLILLFVIGPITAYLQTFLSYFAIPTPNGFSDNTFYLDPPVGHLRDLFHHFIPMLIIMGLSISRALNWKQTVVASSLGILVSPLGSIGIAAFLSFKLFAKGKNALSEIKSLMQSPLFWSACCIVLVGILYFSLSNGTACFSLMWLEFNKPPTYFKGEIILSYLLKVALPLAFFVFIAWFSGNHKNPLCRFIVVMYILLPFFYYGVPKGNNELIMKAAFVIYFPMAYLLTNWLKTAQKWQRLSIYLFIFSSSGQFIVHLCLTGITHFQGNWEQQIQHNNISTVARWHLYHPQSRYYNQFKGEVKHTWLFLDRAGSSSDALLMGRNKNMRTDSEMIPPPTPWKGQPIKSTTSSEGIK